MRWPARRWAQTAAALVAAGLALAWPLLALPRPAAQERAPAVLVARLAEPITPVVAGYLADGVRKAEQEGYAAFLVELDTPGGLDQSMREICQAFLNARVPVVVYVAPPGARAASAGAIITMAAHVAAMAPGTALGAATPVDLQGGEVPDKIINDAAAFAVSVARQQGRNTTFAEEAVREGRSVAAQEALDLDVVDLIAPDRDALLDQLDGREVRLAGGTSVTLRTAGAEVVEHDLGFFRGLLQRLADPNIAFLFLSIGTLALIYELASPGMGLGGAIGAIMLVLGLTALAVLPVNLAGLLLLVLAAALFVGEVLTPGIGVFAAGGTLALAVAGLLLFEGSVAVSPAVLWPTAVVIGAAVIVAGRVAWRARRAPSPIGPQSLVGREATVRRLTGERTGQVFLEGAWWAVQSPAAPLEKGQAVRVISVDGLRLTVEPVSPVTPAPQKNEEA